MKGERKKGTKNRRMEVVERREDRGLEEIKITKACRNDGRRSEYRREIRRKGVMDGKK